MFKYYRSHKVFDEKMLLYLFAISLYLPMIFTNIITISLLFFTVFKYKKIDFKRILNNRSVILFLIMYFIIFTGFWHDIDYKGVLNDLEKKLSFIILPISISTMNVNKNDLKRILTVFFFSGTLFTLIAFCISFSQFIHTNDIEHLTNHGLSLNIGLHATYLSMFLIFSLSYPLFYYHHIKKTIHKRITILFSIISILFIILLATRIVWGLLLFIFIVKVVLLLKSREVKLKRAFLFLLGSMLVIVLLLAFVPPLKERLKEVLNYNNNYSIGKTWKPNVKEVWGGRGVRLLIWESCRDLISEQPVVGYGSTREVQSQLNLNYANKNLRPLLFLMNNRGKVFNAHNQYLGEVLKFGLFLGALFPFFLIYISIFFYKRKNFLGLYFTVIIFGVCFTETILELNKGIVFFTFFLPLMFNYSKQKSIRHPFPPFQ